VDERPAQVRDDEATPRVVLDTNACLDLFVFRDPRAAGLLAALRAGSVVAVTDAACREEWLRVLHYPQLQLDEHSRIEACAAFDALVQSVPTDLVHDGLPALPRCADPDDQKFLRLAQASGARWLVSRDDEVLKLDRRTRRDGLFGIIAPQDWPTP
jgi:putative PIN family toxin of toxin-antitoxin system